MNKFQLNIYFVSLLSFALSFLLNYSIYIISKIFKYKISTSNLQKRLVNNNIPPLGGVATSITFYISAYFLGKADDIFITVGFFGLLMSILGFFDDFLNFNWKVKLILQILIVTIPITQLNIFINFETLINLDLHNNLNYIVSIFWVVLIINSINFIDNMDGLAVVVTGSICFQIIILTYVLNQNKLTDISIILFFILMGFFILNFPPAKLYLGDSGSLFLGFVLGFTSILFTWNNGPTNSPVYAFSPILLFFTIPILDFLVVFKHRMKNKIKVTTGGTDHISHRLLAKGFNEKKVLFAFFIYSLFIFLFVLIYVFFNSINPIYLLIIYLIQFTFTYNYLINLKELQ